MSLNSLVKTYQKLAVESDTGYLKQVAHVPRTILPAFMGGYDRGPVSKGEVGDMAERIGDRKLEVAQETAAAKNENRVPKTMPGISPPSVVKPPEQSWAAKQGLPSTGSNPIDAAIGSGIGMAGLYGAYQLLRDKKHSED